MDTMKSSFYYDKPKIGILNLDAQIDTIIRQNQLFL